MPGVDMSTSTNVMPRCFGASGSVRTRRNPQSHNWAALFHTFCPVTMNSSPSRRARVPSEARSEPEPGSLNSWQNVSSAERSFGRYSRFCSSEAWRSSAGASIAVVAPGKPVFSS